MPNPLAYFNVTKNGSQFLISPGAAPIDPSGLVFVTNQTNTPIYVYYVGAGAFLGQQQAQTYLNGSSLQQQNQQFEFRVANYYPFTWFAIGTTNNSQGYADLMSRYSIQDFLASPRTDLNVAALRMQGCIIITLTPQRDAQPPHNVHPAMAMTGSWDHNNPYLSILNPQSENVDLFLRYFDSAGNATDVGPIAFATPWNAYQVTIAGYTSLWYGFANHGEYTTPAAYFTAHPYDPSGGHHTQQIPQLSGD